MESLILLETSLLLTFIKVGLKRTRDLRNLETHVSSMLDFLANGAAQIF